MNIREEETTMNIQDLFNERNEQNKRITELVLKLENLQIVLDKIKEILGNYKHYSTPDEKQNAENEEIVDKAYELLGEIK